MRKAFFVVLVIVQIAACKKNDTPGGNNPPASTCRITKIDVTPWTPDYFILKYDSEGRLITIEDQGGGIEKREITYQGKNYTLTYYNGSSIKRILTADVTNDGFLTKTTEKVYDAGILTHTIVRHFGYNPDGHLKDQNVDIDANTDYQQYTYDWTLGNLTHEMLNGEPGPPLNPTIHSYYTYDGQKSYPAGNGLNTYDLTRFGEILQFGRILIKNKNPLIKTTISQQGANDFYYTYEYEFDLKDNVSLIKGVNPNSQHYTIAYQYSCDQ